MAAATHVRIEDRLAALGRELRDDDLEPFTRVIHDRTAAMGAQDLVRALQAVVRIGREVAPFFDSHDVWLSPTLGVPVPELGVLDTSNPPSMFARAAELTWFTSVFNVTGLPSASVPAGFDEAGLPVAIQLTGRMGAEAQLLRVAAQLEEAAPWRGRPHGRRPWPADTGIDDRATAGSPCAAPVVAEGRTTGPRTGIGPGPGPGPGPGLGVVRRPSAAQRLMPTPP